MRIQEPEKAIAAYEDARKAFPNNSKLHLVIGNALVATHDYGRATTYYASAAKSDPENAEIAMELAE